MDLPNTKTSTIMVVDPVGSQDRETREARISKGLCPVHETIMTQCDVMYYDKQGFPFTFHKCITPRCRVEVCLSMKDKTITLTPRWQFLLDQDEDGKGKLLSLR